MTAGIVFYRRQGDSLSGRWSHPDFKGMLADERVSGVEAGSFTGTWPVEIFDPAGNRIFEGVLESAEFGQCFRLSWRGTMPDGSQGLFEGIGCALDSDTLCSSFEMVKPDAGQAS